MARSKTTMNIVVAQMMAQAAGEGARKYVKDIMAEAGEDRITTAWQNAVMFVMGGGRGGGRRRGKTRRKRKKKKKRQTRVQRGGVDSIVYFLTAVFIVYLFNNRKPYTGRNEAGEARGFRKANESGAGFIRAPPFPFV